MEISKLIFYSWNPILLPHLLRILVETNQLEGRASMSAPAKENLQFQTEVNQLLHLMIHSLYSNKEIFLRELISNAADACDKLRFEAIGNDSLYENDSDLRVEVEFDSAAHTITIRDNGIGMNRD